MYYIAMTVLTAFLHAIYFSKLCYVPRGPHQAQFVRRIDNDRSLSLNTARQWRETVNNLRSDCENTKMISMAMMA